MKYTSRVVIGLVTAIFALMALLPTVAGATSVTPIYWCTKTASGSTGTYNFPTDCTPSTSFPVTYHTMYINILGQCDSASDGSGATESAVLMKFNNNNEAGLSSTVGDITGTTYANPDVHLVGLVPCHDGLGGQAHTAGSIAIKVFRGQNMSDYQIPWISNWSMQWIQSGQGQQYVGADAGEWWDHEPDGPPLTHVIFTLAHGGPWSAGSQFTVYFDY